MSRFHLEDGGVVRAVLDLCSVLSKRGMDVQIVTWDATDIPEAWKRGDPGAPKVLQVPSPSRAGGFFSSDTLDQVAAAMRECDVLHLHTPWDRTNLQLARRARRIGTPYYITVHGMLDEWSMAQKGLKKRLFLALGGRRLLEGAAGVHCTAQGELEQARKWFPRGEGFVIPLIFDLEPFRTLPGEAAARREIAAADTGLPIVLFLSRLHYKKRPEALIDAAAILRDAGVEFRVLMAGSGEDSYVESLRRRVRERDLEAHVFFVGMVVGEAKVSLFEAAEVFVLPTSQENFGFVLTESLACRTPVITTRGTDIWPELEACGGAKIIEGEPRAIADSIQWMLDHPDAARNMGAKGRAWVFDALDPDAIAAEFERTYERAAAAASR